MRPVRAVISDFGGVLTSPLMHGFAAVQERAGVSLEALGRAMARVTERDGEHPLFELEKGRLSEAEFLRRIEDAVSEELGRPIDLRSFAETYFAGLEPNADLIDYFGTLRARGLRLAMLTNNVREWEPRWREMLPVDEIFEVVVDSAFVGMRKPDPAIFELTLDKLGAEPGESLFVDDLEVNCDAARSLGLSAVVFRSNEQAIAEIEAEVARRR
jgi:putative hydrolase of the HAD superfamily